MTERTDVRAALLGGKTFRSLSEQKLSPKMIRTGLVFDTAGALLIIGIVPVMVAITGIGR